MLRGGLIVVAVLAFALPYGAAAGSGTETTAARERSLESLVLEQINEVRVGHGIGVLSVSPDLSRAALAHTRAMVVNGFFAHESKNGAPFWKRVKSFYAPRSGGWTVGENLAMFGGAKPDAAAIVESWMASPTHRANVLSRQFANVGIAILHDPAAGGVYGGEPTWVVTLDVGAR